MRSNENDPNRQTAVPDSEASSGSAALLLVESLIHGLCENDTLTVDEAITITDRAADVQQDHAEAADGAGAPLWRAHALFGHQTSISTDQGGPYQVQG